MTPRALVRLVPLVVLLLAAAPPVVDPELQEAEQILRAAGLNCDGPALLRFWRERTPSPAQRDRIVRLVDQLGDNDYDVRQTASRDLAALGPIAIPFLNSALRSPDLEVVQRASLCLARVDVSTDRLLRLSAARVLGERRPRGATASLIAYLPLCRSEEELWGAVLDSLARLGPDDPILVDALTDADPSRRAAAAFVLGKLAPSQRDSVRRLLDASDTLVRFEAAHGLVLAGDRAAVPVLIGLIDSNVELAQRSEELLDQIAGEETPIDARLPRRVVWENWWKDFGEKVDLSRIDWNPASQGITVICDCDVGGVSQAGRVWACGRDGKVRWQIAVNNPADVQLLPARRVLVAECFGGNKVTERDRDGKVLWEHKLTDAAVNCQRLPNGNTFIATYTEILEVTPANKVVYSLRKPYRTTCAVKLRSGNILMAASDGRLIEMSTTGREIRSVNVGHLNAWAGVETLPHGGFLVARYSMNTVTEFDVSGTARSNLTVRTPAYATRLRNGNTLAASPDGHFVAEYDRDGKEVWKRETFGRPFRVRRY
jgi:HEAT repeats/PQQ-like domain